MDEGLLLRMLKGIATRNYEACAEAVPESFGLSSSSVSRRYVKATARKLAQFQERSLEDYDLVALFLDGKSFADEQIIIALGVTIDGQKVPLGFVEAATENERVCRRFLADQVDRGRAAPDAFLDRGFQLGPGEGQGPVRENDVSSFHEFALQTVPRHTQIAGTSWRA